MNKIIISAGTGFLGQVLVNFFKDKVSEIVILTRGKSVAKDNVRYINWDAKTMTGWESELENADILINLAGKSVDCRYTEANKKEIYNSRIDSTNILDEAVRLCTTPPKHWLNSATATIYRFSVDKEMDETTGETGDDFSMNIAKSWEAAFFKNEIPGALKTALRTSIVLGKNGGAFLPIKNLALLGMGGKQGPGTQFIGWIHEYDFARAVEFIVRKELTGVVNVVSPTPVRNADFMKKLIHVLHIPVGISISKKLLEFGAKIIGTEAELVLKSRNVIPKRLSDHGFTFEYGDLESAFRNLTK